MAAAMALATSWAAFGQLITIAAASASASPVPAHTVLSLDLRGAISDQSPSSVFSLGRRPVSVMSVVQTLHAAETDNRVRGLFVRLPEGGMNPAAADELRQAFLRFRRAGKTILVHSQGIYPGGAVTSTYQLAASANEIWMQPSSSFQVTGLGSEEVFFRRLFDRLGVTPEFEQRGEYKNAVNPYLFDNFTPQHREATLSWMGSVYQSAINAAAQDRRRPAATLRTLLEAGPYSAEQARANGLIDRVGQVREAEQSILASAQSNSPLMNFADYEPPARLGAGGPTIAVIGAEGDIVTGRGGGGNPFTGGSRIYSDDVAAAFYRAIDDRNVRAIVFRVSSPGGSDTASEQILAAVRAARAANKPVVVSMGGYAASGGYWISSGASAIVAQPTTLTGSIGVFGGRFVLGPALARYGVDVRPIGVGGEYAQGMGMAAPMTNSQRTAFRAWIDGIYEGFIQRVAQGRQIPAARVREIAQGRVWTGAQARDLRLVDQVGGFYDAVARAQQLAGMTGEPRLRMFSGSGSAFGDLARMFGAGGDAMTTLGRVAEISRDPEAQAMLRQVSEARARARGQGAVLESAPDLAR